MFCGIPRGKNKNTNQTKMGRGGARTKQTARPSNGGKAPRKQLKLATYGDFKGGAVGTTPTTPTTPTKTTTKIPTIPTTPTTPTTPTLAGEVEGDTTASVSSEPNNKRRRLNKQPESDIGDAFGKLTQLWRKHQKEMKQKIYECAVIVDKTMTPAALSNADYCRSVSVIKEKLKEIKHNSEINTLVKETTKSWKYKYKAINNMRKCDQQQ